MEAETCSSEKCTDEKENLKTKNNTQSVPITLDDVFAKIGGYGMYQQTMFCFLFLTIVFMGIHLTSAVFISGKPDFRCKQKNVSYTINGYDGDNFSLFDAGQFDNKCYMVYSTDNTSSHVKKKCEEWEFDTSVFTSTAVSEFNLVCDNVLKTAQATMIIMFGVFTGSIVGGYLSDRFGRKKINVWFFLLAITSEILLYVAPSYDVFVCLRYFVGFGVGGALLSAFVSATEIVGLKHRALPGMIFNLCFAVGEIVLIAVAYPIRDWRYLVISISAPFYIAVALIQYFVPESPRWLLSQRKYKEVEILLQSIAKRNGKEEELKSFDVKSIEFTVGELSFRKKYGKLVTSPTLIIRFFIIVICWFSVSIVFYGLLFSSGNLGISVHLGMLIMALIELPANLIGLYMVQKVGRRITYSLFMIISGIACISTIIPKLVGGEDTHIIVYVLAAIGRLCITAAFAIVYIYTAEVFPTYLRNTAVGIGSAGARVGAMVAPFLADIGFVIDGEWGQNVPLIIFGGVGIVVGVLSLKLPETIGRPLPESLEEAENLNKQKNILKTMKTKSIKINI